MSPSSLKSRRVILAVTGGVAVYKAADLVRRLKSEEADVTVVMTEASRRFVSPLTFESLSGNKVYTDVFSDPLAHVSLPAGADLLVIAPATANMIGKLASGIADDMVSLTFLAFRGPVIFAPAMNWRMYGHPVVQRNIRTLRGLGLLEVEPEEGELACGERGVGRMADVGRIVEAAKGCLSKKDLAGRRLLVVAGPTREYIDPVRFISNRSSGKMGYALAAVAARRGADVTLISGPVALDPPPGADVVRVETSEEMLEAVKRHVREADILVMAAAVADFVPEDYSPVKREKGEGFVLRLRPAPDIVKAVSGTGERPFIVGFSAETGPDTAKARRKLEDKGMDFIVFNDVTVDGAGFDSDTNKISIIDREGIADYPLMSKEACAEVILDRCVELSG
ncbi:MAG: bifunctional phosphopantothenoylcysteine decarboxylase/phosphopantothenate--cysteine ligase CoaBC [Nitrospirae bacterium]|nr:bifunctional phosphopantothenoylcysteine decarboxylase/phosphopantothenate--cysteine ligase CoaBC [Nitrospirota bacterium]